MQVKKDKITGDSLGVGRRKTAVARVRVKTGSGKISVNGRELEQYFPSVKDQRRVVETLDVVGVRGQVDVWIRATGGGQTGQADACRMGIARALIGLNPDSAVTLRENGFLTRDSRMKERKKYGLRGARRGVQFSKR